VHIAARAEAAVQQETRRPLKSLCITGHRVIQRQRRRTPPYRTQRPRPRSADGQVQTFDRCCATSDLGSSVDTVVVGWQTASLPTLAVSAGEVRFPWPSRYPRYQSHPFGKYPSNGLECAHRYPPTIDLANNSTAAISDIDENQIGRAVVKNRLDHRVASNAPKADRLC